MKRKAFLSWVLLAIGILGAGCGTCGNGAGNRAGNGAGKEFVIGRDTFAYPNELVWTYEFGESNEADGSGEVTTRKSDPPPEYSHHCFPMSRAAREFFYHAQFDASLPPTSKAEYERLIRAVVGRDSRCPSPAMERLVFPGYANLAEFSAAHDDLLKKHCGGAWRSYVQRGNWRMIFPMSRVNQRRMAEKLQERLERGELPVVHIHHFPQLAINHAVLLHDFQQGGAGTIFYAYDPNSPERSAILQYDSEAGQFEFERNHYFVGGPVKVYEVYRNALY